MGFDQYLDNLISQF